MALSGTAGAAVPGPDTGELVSVPLSALEHIEYCERQAALIHVEATWAESIDTVRGDLAHAQVDVPASRRRKGTIVVLSMPVQSRRYGLHGVCDVVEIQGAVAMPVEHKVGAYRPDGPADLQVVGQAACLMEAGFDVPMGSIYSNADRRRHEVPITEDLLTRMASAADRMRVLLISDALPLARHDRRCRRCSLRDDCLPELTCTRQNSYDLFSPRPLGAWRD